MNDNKQTLVSLQTLLAAREQKSGTPSETSKTLTGKQAALDHETKVLINMIFARFHHIYTHRFESAYRDETTLNQAKREWAMSLSGVSANLIEMALERCKREHAWPPTIAEFLKLTQPEPESLGLPTVDKAYFEACRLCHQPTEHLWSHLCVKLAAQDTGYYFLRSEPERITRPAFEKSYRKLIERLAQGETLSVEPRPTALPSPDLKLEDALTEKLAALKVEPTTAANIAYYLEKPKGSDVRKRYRERAVALVESLEMKFDLPE